jgi:pimeloyl-ACP methyl ester carboxylesterase
LAWRVAGAAPPVLITTQNFAHRTVTSALVDELAGDHRVLVYDPRGTGESTRRGPYDTETDAGDLAALLEQADAAGAVVVGIANGCDVAVLLGARHPHLVRGIVVPSGNPAGLRAARRSETMAGSEGVLEALEGMVANDYRSALWTVLTSGNPGMDEDEIRRRIDTQAEYCPADVAAARLRAWLEVDCLDEARSLGDRLHILLSATNPWFPDTLARSTRELLPEARVDEVEDGHLSRPDISAAAVREMTSSNS